MATPLSIKKGISLKEIQITRVIYRNYVNHDLFS